MWMTRVSIANPVFAAMVMLALCVLGLAAYDRLNVEQMPDVAPPVVFVQIQYPGASPDGVERDITKPVEETLNTIAGVKRITSRAFEGRSETDVEFTLDADMGRAMQDLRDRMGAIQSALPKDARAPMIVRFNQEDEQPTVSLALLGPQRSLRDLSVLAEQTIQRRLQRVAGVARVQLNGLATREIRIDLDAQRLRALALTPAEVAAALKAANADHAVGLLSDGIQDSLVRVEGRVLDPQRFQDVVVAQRGGLPVRLADIGRVVEREREADSASRVNGSPGIGINVQKQQDANVVKTGEAVKKAVEELRKQLPPDVELRTIYASSDWVGDSLRGLQRTLVEGALLTVAIVFLFLHSWRSTIITGLTLPIAVISSFIAIKAFGFTLNFMTMMALSLCIGLLIDDAIVVRENIVRHVQMGKGHHQAALEGTQEIGLAVLATTFALCAVFVPVAFMEGIIGRFFYPFGITVAVAVLVSLFVSFTLDPMLSSVWRDPDAEQIAATGHSRMHRLPVIGALLRGVDRAMEALHRVYERLVDWIFSGRRWRLPLPAFGRPFGADGKRDRTQPRGLRRATFTPRGVVMLVALASLVGALGLVPLVGSEFIPQTDQSFTQVSLRMPEGSSLQRASDKVRQVEQIILAMPETKSTSAWIGGPGQRNQAWIQIALKDRKDRQRSQKEVEDALRGELKHIPGIDAAMGFNRPIYVAILGNDAKGLARVAKEFADKVRAIPGTVDVESTVRPGIPAFAVRPKESAVRELGLTGAQLAASLRTFVTGDAATTWTAPDGGQVEVVLRLPEAERQRAAQLGAWPVAYAKDGTPIRLDSVATIEPVFNPEIIRRQNLQRREAVFGGVKPGASTGDVGNAVQKLVKETKLPAGYTFDIGGQTQEQAAAFGGLVKAMAMAIMFIYIVLASQFGSFLQPLAIMASLPLALIGVMLALLLWRSTLNVFSMIGLVMLMGLVTKNAILLVDHANQMRRERGMGVAEALRTAGTVRMRPIVMTTAAMVFGMLPLAMAFNEGGEIQAPMGRAIIGGVITSTLLTLVVVPVVYSYIEQFTSAWRQRRAARLARFDAELAQARASDPLRAAARDAGGPAPDVPAR